MKKRMRYICCLMLAASLTAGLLAGCGNDTAGTKDKKMCIRDRSNVYNEYIQ